MRERKIYAEGVSEGSHAFCAAGIFGYDDTGFPVEDVFADPAGKRRFGVEIVYGDGEEALHLGGVEVHGYDVGYSCHCEEVGDHWS